MQPCSQPDCVFVVLHGWRCAGATPETQPTRGQPMGGAVPHEDPDLEHQTIDRVGLSLLEDLSFNAWPAAVVETVDGWRHRYTEGVTRRANSVWSNRPTGRTSLADRIDAAEAFYARRAADACFLVSPASPAGLDARLADRGYRENGATFLQTAPLARVQTATSCDFALTLAPAPDEAWQALAWPDAALRPDVRREIVARIKSEIACARVRVDGTNAACGLGVLERGHVGIFAMRTHPGSRGLGLASGILHALARWGRERGASIAYLQVEQDNPPAQRLYARAGFETRYRYHYRSRATS